MAIEIVDLPMTNGDFPQLCSFSRGQPNNSKGRWSLSPLELPFWGWGIPHCWTKLQYMEPEPMSGRQKIIVRLSWSCKDRLEVIQQKIKPFPSGWWFTYRSEKYEFVSWDDETPNIWKIIKNGPNHQPAILFSMSRSWPQQALVQGFTL